MATPFVAGAMASLLSAPEFELYTAAEALQWLTETSIPQRVWTPIQNDVLFQSTPNLLLQNRILKERLNGTGTPHLPDGAKKCWNFTVVVNPETFAEKVQWHLNIGGYDAVGAGDDVHTVVELCKAGQYTFTIQSKTGLSKCCGYTPGSYGLFLDGSQFYHRHTNSNVTNIVSFNLEHSTSAPTEERNATIRIHVTECSKLSPVITLQIVCREFIKSIFLWDSHVSCPRGAVACVGAEKLHTQGTHAVIQFPLAGLGSEERANLSAVLRQTYQSANALENFQTQLMLSLKGFESEASKVQRMRILGIDAYPEDFTNLHPAIIKHGPCGKSTSTFYLVAFFVAFSACVVLIALLLGVLMRSLFRKRKKNVRADLERTSDDRRKTSSMRSRDSPVQLYSLDAFVDDVKQNMIDEWSVQPPHRVAYKGALRHGPLATAIVFHTGDSSSKLWMVAFTQLVSYRHPNLLPLQGLCLEGTHPILVYLDIDAVPACDYLAERKWFEKVAVAAKVASCLEYLHSEIHAFPFHGAIESKDVQVTSNGEVFVMNFGLTWLQLVTSAQSSDRLTALPESGFEEDSGTAQRVDGKQEVDIYDFGLLMLDILAPHRAQEFIHSLREHASDSIGGCFFKSVEGMKNFVGSQTLEGWPEACLSIVFGLMKDAVDPNPSQRPKARTVARILQGLCDNHSKEMREASTAPCLPKAR